ncbi:MAG: sigma-54 dependent transcriptional regulator [bacterium]|jgi:DNA-binding NtrC family response regulator
MAKSRKSGFSVVLFGSAALAPEIPRALTKLGCTAKAASSVEDALKALESGNHAVLIADVDQPDVDVADFLKECKKSNRETAVILLAEDVKVEMAFEAARLGAFQCLPKPVDIDKLAESVDRGLDGARLKREAQSVRQIVVGYREFDRFVVGKSKMMEEIAEVIEKVAESRASTVLIQGESGTGKELVARGIHFQGPSKDKPFMEINCASLPEHLLESELFGHEKGAFTDAMAKKKGLVELSEGGTLFLDEIGEMPMGLQSRVLRLIETKRFRSVGGVEDIVVNTRIIAATNRDLKVAMDQDKFRSDLYFRLMVIPIYVPALRERKQDIPILSSYFIDHFNRELTRSVRGLSREARDIMMRYHWPGNVRELRNTIERAILLESTDLILAEHLPAEMLDKTQAGPSEISFREQARVPISLQEAEKRAIIGALEWAGGNKSSAARVLGITRQTLRQKIKKYHLADF